MTNFTESIERFFGNSFFKARTTDPETSHAAAASAKLLATRHHWMITSALKLKDGQTIYELAESTGLPHNSVARRMSELEEGGVVYTEGKRKGKTQRMCRIWYKTTLTG
jgi:predicted transcriptional regulator